MVKTARKGLTSPRLVDPISFPLQYSSRQKVQSLLPLPAHAKTSILKTPTILQLRASLG